MRFVIFALLLGLYLGHLFDKKIEVSDIEDKTSPSSLLCLEKCQNRGYNLSLYRNEVCSCSNEIAFPMED